MKTRPLFWNHLLNAVCRKLPTAQQTLAFFQRPTTIAFGGGVTFIALFYAVVISNEWQTHINELQNQLNRNKQKWQTERLSLDSKVSRLELSLNRTELELSSTFESVPRNGSNWSKSVIELKYDECMAKKKK
ncbi:hypothetical protein GpartN1_g4662.t1 [Galdieria partita]|uniref:Uncharacterized protein n=1 Tax=Galdieria partita TaxID=83374 RepID=A0A9C7PZR7_9RHOD|nr:hypothetical protein GpartN1_g4662.t1 [Galdieria partita]